MNLLYKKFTCTVNCSHNPKSLICARLLWSSRVWLLNLKILVLCFVIIIIKFSIVSTELSRVWSKLILFIHIIYFIFLKKESISLDVIIHAWNRSLVYNFLSYFHFFYHICSNYNVSHKAWRKNIIESDFSVCLCYRNYVMRCYSMCKTNSDRDKVDDFLRATITSRANENGRALLTHDWEHEPLPAQ